MEYYYYIFFVRQYQGRQNMEGTNVPLQKGINKIMYMYLATLISSKCN
jgi:hypothetical protein